MTCAEAREAFSHLYDRALSGPALAAVKRHLEGCPACTAEWTAFRRAVEAVTDLGSAEPSPGFAARIRRQVESLPWWRRALRWLFLPLHVKVPIQALTLILVAFAGLLLVHRSPELQRELEPRSPSPPPVTRKAPEPAPPTATDETPRAAERATPRPVVPKTEQAPRPAPPAPAAAPPAQPLTETEKAGAPSAVRDEAKELEKTMVPSESSKGVEAPEGSGAKTSEPGTAARQLMRSAPAPLQAPASPQASAPARGGQLSPVPPASADQLYSTALADLDRRRYDPAIGTLRTFVQQNPRDSRVPEARLRMADAYVAQQRYADAIPEYEALVREFPDSPLVPTALYREAQARLALGDRVGCQMHRDLILRYPQAPEALLAREALSARCP